MPYLIESIEDLVFFAQDVTNGNTYNNQYVKLTTSLNFNADSSYVNPYIENFFGYSGALKTSLTSGDGFHGIGSAVKNEKNNFSGFFDGNNCIISNLLIRTIQNSESGVGFFSYNYGTIRNIGLENVNINAVFDTEISGTMFVGGIVGRNEGTVDSVFVRGNISSEYTGTRNSNIRTGGLCGQITSGKIQNSYNTATISTRGNCGNSTTIGGCVGTLSTDAILSNSYNVGSIKENNNKTIESGGIVGANSQISSTIENCYYLKETYFVGIGYNQGNSDKEENLNKTNQYMKSNDFLNLLGVSGFKLEKGKNNGYPILYWQ